MQATMWKSIKSWVRNWCQKWPCILFGAIYREKKQCQGSVYLESMGFCFYKHNIKVYVSCFSWCPGTSVHSATHLTVSLYAWSSGSNTWGQVEGPCARIIRLMRYLHVLRVLHSSSAGPNWAETGYKINDITWFVNVVAFLAPNSKTLSVLKLPLNLQPRWIDFVCQQRHRPWKSGVLCLAKCTSSSNYTWCCCAAAKNR